MTKKRYDVLLFNAIDLLLRDMDRNKICEELGMTEKEFESVGEIADSIVECKPIWHER